MAVARGLSSSAMAAELTSLPARSVRASAASVGLDAPDLWLAKQETVGPVYIVAPIEIVTDPACHGQRCEAHVFPSGWIVVARFPGYPD